MALFRDMDTNPMTSVTFSQTKEKPPSTTNTNNDGATAQSDQLTEKLSLLLDQKFGSLKKLDKLDKIDNLETLIRSSIQSNTEQFSIQEKKIKHLENKVTNLEFSMEQLQKDIRHKNLIIYGIPDDGEGEDYTTIYLTVCQLIFEITERPIKPDTVFRMGEQKPNQPRPVKVSFALQNERDCVFYSREKLEDDFTIKADIPFTMRRDFAILQSKTDELNKAGKKAELNFRKREIVVNGAPAFAVIDGSLQQTQHTVNLTAHNQPTENSSVTPSTSKNGFTRPNTKRKRGGYVPNPNLINSDNLRSSKAKFRKISNNVPQPDDLLHLN